MSSLSIYRWNSSDRLGTQNCCPGVSDTTRTHAPFPINHPPMHAGLTVVGGTKGRKASTRQTQVGFVFCIGGV